MVVHRLFPGDLGDVLFSVLLEPEGLCAYGAVDDDGCADGVCVRDLGICDSVTGRYGDLPRAVYCGIGTVWGEWQRCFLVCEYLVFYDPDFL